MPVWLSASCGGLLRSLAMGVALAAVVPSAFAAESFPFDHELLLDVAPMRGSKRVPMLEIGPGGETSVDLWCNSLKAQLVVVEDTITIVPGPRSERQCSPEQMSEDDALIAALQEVTNWSKEGDILVLRGPKTLRYRLSTH
jgi:heat shock protein HslJ